VLSKRVFDRMTGNVKWFKSNLFVLLIFCKSKEKVRKST